MLGQEPGLLLVVGGVEDLDPVEPGLAEQRDLLEHLVGVLDVPERVGPDRRAARVVDPADRLLDSRAGARQVGGRARDQVGRDEGGDVRVALLLQPLLVGGVLEHRRRQVGTAHGLAGGLARLDRLRVDLVAQLVELRAHPLRAALAVGAGVAQPLEQHGVVVVDPVAQHVKVLVVVVDRGDLGGGHDGDRLLGAGAQGLVDTIHRVVVGQRHQLDPGLRGALHHIGGLEQAIGVEGVRLEIESGPRHRRKG